MQRFKPSEPRPQSIVGADLVDRDALSAHRLPDPVLQGGVRLQQEAEGARCTCAHGGERNGGRTSMGPGSRIRHHGAPAPGPAIVVGLATPIEHSVQSRAVDAAVPLDRRQ